jgi:hypothetical protein
MMGRAGGGSLDVVGRGLCLRCGDGEEDDARDDGGEVEGGAR